MHRIRWFFSRKKQVFLFCFSLTFLTFLRKSKNRLNTSLPSQKNLYLSFGYTKPCCHPQSPTSTQKHPGISHNHPKSATTTHNQPQTPRIKYLEYNQTNTIINYATYYIFWANLVAKMRNAQNFMKFGTVVKSYVLNVSKILNIATCYILTLQKRFLLKNNAGFLKFDLVQNKMLVLKVVKK